MKWPYLPLHIRFKAYYSKCSIAIVKGHFFYPVWTHLQLQSRALSLNLRNCMVCTYLQKHLPCLFLKPVELEGEVLFFLGSPEKHTFILLPSGGLNNCPLSSYNILQPSHVWEPGSRIRWCCCWVGGSASLWMTSETRGKALSLVKWMASFPFSHDFKCKCLKWLWGSWNMSWFLPLLPFGFVLVVSRCWEPQETRVLVKWCLNDQRRMVGGKWWGGRWRRGSVVIGVLICRYVQDGRPRS